jgi:hypothetical protein
MSKRPVIACVAALLISGCGVDVQMDPADPESLSTQQQPIIWECASSTDYWVRYWYTDSSRSYETGREYCCGGLYEKLGTYGNSYVGQVLTPSTCSVHVEAKQADEK